MRKILTTYALTYANGSLHLGHLVGFIQTDIWVRFQKMQGINCLYISGCDAHGTPIMIQAEKLKIAPEELVEKIRIEQHQDLRDFFVEVDNYHTTHSEENQLFTESIYETHLKKGNIIKHAITQAFDAEKNMFLPDRYIKGECPKCGAKDQYGDNCEVCGSTYSPIELKNPYSTLTGTKPIEKESEHYFFKLQNFATELQHWTRDGHLQNQVANKLDEWFAAGLKEWDISRDAPYFGFKIPQETEKYFYCWLDAPIGYIASFKNFAENHHLNFNEYWQKDSTVELYHFIGKDIMYFHTLFWPAVLKGADYRTPTGVFCHGFLTIDGQKMSKSRGTFIKAATFKHYLNPEFLRYYFATKLSDRIEDLDLNFDDFAQKVNADLIGKFVNIASRTASFITKYFDNQLATTIDDHALLNAFQAESTTLATLFETRQFSQAMKHIMSLTDRANQYIDEKKPWSAIKDPHEKTSVHQVCTIALNLFRILMIYLKPVLPHMAEKVETFFNAKPFIWQDSQHLILNQSIKPYSTLAERLDKVHIQYLKNAAKNETA